MEKASPILVKTCAAVVHETNEIKKLSQWSQKDLQAITVDYHATPINIPQAEIRIVNALLG
ncbi:MAG: hypothetical protein GY763_03245 [Gammaproteobacteria bacterium]|nr:hypothetical protein [Gammaproteobacteria bacterium]